jgi:hypothetical protein
MIPSMARIYYMGTTDYLGLTIRYSFVDGNILYRCTERNGSPVCDGAARDLYDVKRRVRGVIRAKATSEARTGVY